MYRISKVIASLLILHVHVNYSLQATVAVDNNKYSRNSDCFDRYEQ